MFLVKGDKLDLIKLENNQDNFLCLQISTSQPLILCILLLGSGSFVLFNNSLLKCKYLLGVVQPCQLIVDCCMIIGSYFNGARLLRDGVVQWKGKWAQEKGEENIYWRGHFWVFLIFWPEWPLLTITLALFFAFSGLALQRLLYSPWPEHRLN